MARRKLTLKQQRFVDAYLATGNATEAARRAGYDASEAALRHIGWENLTKLDIQRRIKARMADSDVTADEVIGTLATQMRADVTDLFTSSNQFSIDDIREKGLGHLLKKVKLRREWEGDRGDKVPVDIIEIELHSQQSAAVQLCKVLGIEREPAPNDETRRRDLADRMLRKLLDRGLSEEEARESLISLGVDHSDIAAVQGR